MLFRSEGAPAIVPIVADLLGPHRHKRPARRGGQLRQRRQLTRRAVHGEFDRSIRERRLFNAARREPQQLCEYQLGLLWLNPDREAKQRLPAEHVLELREHALVGAQVVVGHRTG